MFTLPNYRGNNTMLLKNVLFCCLRSWLTPYSKIAFTDYYYKLLRLFFDITKRLTGYMEGSGFIKKIV